MPIPWATPPPKTPSHPPPLGDGIGGKSPAPSLLLWNCQFCCQSTDAAALMLLLLLLLLFAATATGDMENLLPSPGVTQSGCKTGIKATKTAAAAAQRASHPYTEVVVA